jgi:D-mannonate dehydratase
LNKSLIQYDEVLSKCKNTFEQKTKDYGSAWRILRSSSLTDQIFIKARRIRQIEENGFQEVSDSIDDDYIGIINYCIMAVIQLEATDDLPIELDTNSAVHLFEKTVKTARDLFEKKNHDYGEVWRDMRISSYTDLILMKLLRVKQIEDNKGKTLISEGLDANYLDMLNYSVFALIKIEESKA